MSQVTEIYSIADAVRTKANVFETLRKILADVLVADVMLITRDADLEQDLGAESIDFVDLSFRVEEEFGITFRLEEFRSSGNPRKYTVELLADYIVRSLASGRERALA